VDILIKPGADLGLIKFWETLQDVIEFETDGKVSRFLLHERGELVVGVAEDWKDGANNPLGLLKKVLVFQIHGKVHPHQHPSPLAGPLRSEFTNRKMLEKGLVLLRALLWA